MNNINSAGPSINLPSQVVAPRPRGDATALHDNEVLRKACKALDDYRAQSDIKPSERKDRIELASYLDARLKPESHGEAGTLDLSRFGPDAVAALPHDVIEALASRTSTLSLPSGSRPTWLKDLSKLTELTVRQPGKVLDLTDLKSLKQLNCVDAGKLCEVNLRGGVQVDPGKRTETRGKISIAYVDNKGNRILSPQRRGPVQSKLMMADTAGKKGDAGSPMQARPMVARTAEEKGKARVPEPEKAAVVPSSFAPQKSDGPNTSQAAPAPGPAAHESRASGSAPEPSPAQVQPGDAPELPQGQGGQKSSRADEFEEDKDGNFDAGDFFRLYGLDVLPAKTRQVATNTPGIQDSRSGPPIKPGADAADLPFSSAMPGAACDIPEPAQQSEGSKSGNFDAGKVWELYNLDIAPAKTRQDAYAKTPGNEAVQAESSRRGKQSAIMSKIDEHLRNIDERIENIKKYLGEDEAEKPIAAPAAVKSGASSPARTPSPPQVQTRAHHVHQSSKGGLDERLAMLVQSRSDPMSNLSYLDLPVTPGTRDAPDAVQQARDAKGKTKVPEILPDAGSSSARNPAEEQATRWDVMSLIDKDEDGWTPLAKAFKEDPDRISSILGILAQAEAPVLDTVNTLRLNGMLVKICAARDPHGKPGLVYALESGKAESIRSYGEMLKQLDLDQHDRARLAQILDSAVNVNLGFIRIARPVYRNARQENREAAQAYKKVIRDLREVK